MTDDYWEARGKLPRAEAHTDLQSEAEDGTSRPTKRKAKYVMAHVRQNPGIWFIT